MSDPPSVVIRPAEARDLPALGRLGAALMRAHYAFDRDRFLAPGLHPEEGYGRFLASQHGDDVAVLVAERDGRVVGYVYAGVEPRSWKELRDVAGFIHDVVVDETARGSGVGARLVEAAAEWLVVARGVPRVMLWTAQQNASAQRLFERLGFRRTMIEMTREAKPKP